MNEKGATWIAAACAWVGLIAGLTTGAEPVRDHDIVLDDYFTQSYIPAIRVSPDGGSVAYEGRWDEDLDRRNLDLWTVDAETRETLRLTFDPADDEAPAWSPDGRWIYFRSNRSSAGAEGPPYDGSAQVWRVPAAGGEAVAVTRVKDGVEAFDLARDGNALYYTVRVEETDTDRWGALRKRFDKLDYGHGVVKYSVLWAIDLRTWRSRKLVEEHRVIRSFAVSPDGRRIAMVTTPTDRLISNEGWSDVAVYDTEGEGIIRLDDRPWREEAPSPYGWIVGPAWSSDGRKLSFRVDFDGYPAEMFVAHFESGGGEAGGGMSPAVTKLVRPGGVSAEGPMAWFSGTHDLGFVADDHALARLVRITAIEPSGQGPSMIETPGDVVIDAFDVSDDGARIALLARGMTFPQDVFMMRGGLRAGGDAGARPIERLTNVNPQVDTWKLPQIRLVKWRSPDGTEIEGILELPPDYAGDHPLPTLVSIHGGPTLSSKLAFRFWIYGRTLFSSMGWAVFDPNYRGSTGYGDAFLTDLIGNENHLDVQDILSGVDMLVDAGVADPDELAVMGWSNGGYLTNCLITATDRFKAASSGAGVFDMVMQWSIEDTPGHVINYMGGQPWEQETQMRRSSPLFDADKVVTPTLIHVGSGDERVPPAHSLALHRALHQYLGVPCELVMYPGTGHGLSKLSYRKAKMTWDVEWLQHYVGVGGGDE